MVSIILNSTGPFSVGKILIPVNDIMYIQDNRLDHGGKNFLMLKGNNLFYIEETVEQVESLIEAALENYDMRNIRHQWVIPS